MGKRLEFRWKCTENSNIEIMGTVWTWYREVVNPKGCAHPERSDCYGHRVQISEKRTPVTQIPPLRRNLGDWRAFRSATRSDCFGNSKNVNCLNPKFWKSEKPMNIQLKNALFLDPNSTVNFQKCRSTFSLWIGYDFGICHFFPQSRGSLVPLRRRGIVICGGEGRGARPFRNVRDLSIGGHLSVFLTFVLLDNRDPQMPKRRPWPF